mgnify:FL=1
MAQVEKRPYKEYSVYQIWPRSFCDGNGDGIGDLQGVYSKLDYIKSLGVDVIWFSPLYPSPNADYGYDISDYKNINPEYGTLDDFKKVLDGAHERGMKVLMDLVVNHTSDEHYWFKESLKGDDNPYHDYYYWRKGKGKDGKKPPNNWLSTFEGGAWEYNEKLKEFYLHVFAKKQPDLNMDNPKVREEVKDILRFWLDMGVDGFREDVITFISKPADMPNGFPLPAATGIEHYKNGPKVHDYLKEFRDEVLGKYDCFTVGESPMMTMKNALPYITEGKDQVLSMMFHFQHQEADCFITEWVHTPFRLRKMKKAFSSWQYALYGRAWNSLYLENHDHARIINRYGNVKYHKESGKMLATMCYLQCGTPFIYQGQEIGMLNIKIDSLDKYKDVLTFNNYKIFKKLGISDEKFLKIANRSSRENARTPMQWSGAKYAGFSDEKPWFELNPNYKKINVEEQEKDPDSILNYYRRLIKLRKENEIFIYGDYKEHNKLSGSLYVYERNYEGRRAIIICSFKEKGIKFTAPQGFDLSKGELVLCNYGTADIKDNSFVTRPYEARVYLF